MDLKRPGVSTLTLEEAAGAREVSSRHAPQDGVICKVAESLARSKKKQGMAQPFRRTKAFRSRIQAASAAAVHKAAVERAEVP